LKLRPFQKHGVKFLRSRKSALLLDSMGCGKTIQLLCSIPKKAPVIIIAPAVAKGNWAKECSLWRPDLEVKILSGRNSFYWPRPGEVLVINYDILPRAAQVRSNNARHGISGSPSYRLVREYYDIESHDKVDYPSPDRPVIGTVIISDEVHKVKSNKAKRSKSLKAMARLVRSTDGVLWGATGTPITNYPPELWNILDIFDLKEEFCVSWSNFLRLFDARQAGGFGGSIEWNVPEIPKIEVIDSLRRVSIMRKLDDVVEDMPAKTRQDFTVDIDKATERQCDKALVELERVGISLEEALEEAARTQVESVRFQELARARSMLAAAKVPFALELIEEYEEQSEPLLVFSAHRAPIEILKGREGWGIIMGGVSDKLRKKAEEDFQGGKLKGLGLTTKAGGIAITLHRASHALFVDLLYSPADNLQAEDRIHRIGQTRPQIIRRLMANHPLDRRCMEIITHKMLIIERTVDASAIKGEPDYQNENLNPVTSVLGSGVIVDDPRKVHIQQQSPRRAARTDVERWTAGALRLLAAWDPDHATMANKRGFDAQDSRTGRSLASKLGMGLTDPEWARAVVICRKYQKQIERESANV
jgi:SWI/SNF-related matrix-associated actin-dependent regulator 1 of chromatin subfamily A